MSRSKKVTSALLPFPLPNSNSSGYTSLKLLYCSIIDCLYVLIMSHTRFRVNLRSIVARMSRNSLPEAGAISEV